VITLVLTDHVLFHYGPGNVSNLPACYADLESVTLAYFAHLFLNFYREGDKKSEIRTLFLILLRAVMRNGVTQLGVPMIVLCTLQIWYSLVHPTLKTQRWDIAHPCQKSESGNVLNHQ